ncbi:DUF2061 domain-containing protein [Herminiimonas sp. NPDC097707]|uniref:DUF2061 domain-containing protein n=1 Tax=Herminiimonas sp. NPDC097707 TaxID=3364007 RepID=UPI00383A7F53
MVTAAKTTSQICLHMGVAFGLMYLMTGSLAIGGVAAVVEPICNVALLPLHDRMWARIRAKVEAKQADSSAVTADASIAAG